MARMSGGSAPGWAGRGSGAAPGPAPAPGASRLRGSIPDHPDPSRIPGLASGPTGGRGASRGWGDPRIPGLSWGAPGGAGSSARCPAPAGRAPGVAGSPLARGSGHSSADAGAAPQIPEDLYLSR